MRHKPTATDTSLDTVSSTARLYPDELARHAGEHPAFVDPSVPAGLVDRAGTTWFTFAPSWPTCPGCGLPVREYRLTCGSRLCPGVR